MNNRLERDSNSFDCVIVGAGPSGLSLAYQLQKKRISYIVVEKKNVGNSWSHMADSLHLVSPWWTNCLSGTFINPLIALKKHSGKQYLSYLERYSGIHKLNIQENFDVTEISTVDNDFMVKSQDCVINAKLVVLCTGYYSTPYVPIITHENDNSIPFLHASKFKNVKCLKDDFPGVKKILIVGKRVTAGQLMVELHEAGIDVDLSVRGRVIVKDNDTFLGRLKEQIYFFWEFLRIKFQPNLKVNSFPEMDGGKSSELIQSGEVRTFEIFHKIENGKVYMGTGNESYDLIYFATGYLPNISLVNFNNEPDYKTIRISDSLELETTSGIYLLGFDNITNFRSRYLRGIKQDAKLLSKILVKRLGQK